MNYEFIPKDVFNPKTNKIDTINDIKIDGIIYTKEDLINPVNEEILIRIIKETDLIGTKLEPIVDIYNQKHNKYEILLETTKPFQLLIGKLEMGDIMENINYNIGTEITMKHLRNIQKIEQLGSSFHHGEKYTYAINFGKKDIENPEILEFLKDNNELFKEKIEMEILEGVPTYYLIEDKTKKTLEKFHALSVKLKLDDYGTGENNIERIELLREHYKEHLDAIKLDGEYVRYLTLDVGSEKRIDFLRKNNFHALNSEKRDFKKIFAKDFSKLPIDQQKRYNQMMEKAKVSPLFENLSEQEIKDKFIELIDNSNENTSSEVNKKVQSNFNKIFRGYMSQRKKFVEEEFKKVKELSEKENLKIIAEVVENRSIAVELMVQANGIDFAQGFLFTNNNKDIIQIIEGVGISNGKLNVKNIIDMKHKEEKNIRIKNNNIYKSLTTKLFNMALNETTSIKNHEHNLNSFKLHHQDYIRGLNSRLSTDDIKPEVKEFLQKEIKTYDLDNAKYDVSKIMKGEKTYKNSASALKELKLSHFIMEHSIQSNINSGVFYEIIQTIINNPLIEKEMVENIIKTEIRKYKENRIDRIRRLNKSKRIKEAEKSQDIWGENIQLGD